ncbi:MAG: TetR family transcriptional regulator, partial [Spirochaetales bacterium]|nr:TetR family transcriptional regulator [Spirochaetales bacterium]
MKRTQEDAEKTRQSILDAGLALFMEKGYSHTSMEDIAKAANVTRGAIYWHFKSKEDFVIAVADSIYQETSEKVNRFFGMGTTLVEKITITLKNLGYWYLEDDQICLKRKVLSSVL